MDLAHAVRLALGLFGAGYGARVWFQKHQMRKPGELKKTARARVADAVCGRVRLEGTVVSCEPLVTAPFSDTLCVAYEVMIEFKAGHGMNWFFRIIDAASFELDDGSGTAYVAIDSPDLQPTRQGPTGLSVVVPAHVSVTARAGVGDQPKIDWLLSSYGISRGNAKRVTVSESIVQSGDRVTVVGSGSIVPVPAGGESPRRYRVGANLGTLIIGPDL